MAIASDVNVSAAKLLTAAPTTIHTTIAAVSVAILPHAAVVVDLLAASYVTAYVVAATLAVKHHAAAAKRCVQFPLNQIYIHYK